MSGKFSQGELNLEEMKQKMDQVKQEYEKAKKEQSEKKAKGEILSKEPLGKKIIGIILLVLLVSGVGLILWFNLDTILLPKNSITILVVDQNNEAINGLKIHLNGPTMYDQEFEDISDITILDAKPGDYNLIFESIPDGYTCSKTQDYFTLAKDGKVKLEYECRKE